MKPINSRCLIIAEAGVNHNGSMHIAHQLIDAAADAGADAIKFQTFKAEKLASTHARKATYQSRQTDRTQTQLDMLKALELSESQHVELLDHCTARRIEFMSSPFDMDSLNFLAELKVERLKLGSGEISNAPLLLAAAQTGLPLILSTGMCNLADVEAALGVLAFGYGQTQAPPSRQAFAHAWNNATSRRELTGKVTLLHCTTEYPAPRDQVNLRAMTTLAHAFGLPCGYSDHTEGLSVSLAAVALGACVIEKHLTLDKSLPGPDHKASIEPSELKALVDGVREIEDALGDGVKIPVAAEIPNMVIARKSIVAAHSITKHQVLCESDLAIKRPGHGVSPMEYWTLLGASATRDYDPDDMILAANGV